MASEHKQRVFPLSHDRKIACSLSDLVPMTRVKQLLEALYQITHVPIGLVSPDSKVLLAIDWQPICEVFHRGHPESARCCLESNIALQSQMSHGKIAAEKCKNGLWDVAMPVMVDDNHLATLFLGQFLYDDEEVDYGFFEAQAKRYNYAPEQYLQALKQVPHISRAQVAEHISYAVGMVSLLAELGYKNQQLAWEIQERQLAEYALREGERQYRALVENVPGAVYQCLNDDIYTTIFISDAVEGIAGVSARTMVEEALPIASIIHPDDLAYVQNTVSKAVSVKMPYVLNYRMTHKDGGYTWVEERGQGVWDETGELRFLQGVIFDISDRKKLEAERLKLAEQMARAHNLESLSILAGGVAHDFNNLLVAILGHATLIVEEAKPATDTYESANAIVQSAQRAANLTRQMLAYSGKGYFMVEPVNLSGFVRDLAPLFEATCVGEYSFQYDLPEALPAVHVDAQQLKQMLVNLVTNAAEAYEQTPGVIIIRTGMRHCDDVFIESAYHNDQHAAGEYVFVEVTDFGCGMSEKILKHLCDPFFSTKFTGRGLGMAAVLGIVRGHRGLIAIDSTPGKGTTIQALFPVFAPQQEREATPEQFGAARTAGRIMLIDDEAIVRNVARKMLERAGYSVFVAQSGWEALQLLEQYADDISCIILDLTMPNMDGAKTLQAIRQKNTEIPVILSSGYGEEEANSRLSKRHIAAFLQKPYDASVLVETLQRVLQ